MAGTFLLQKLNLTSNQMKLPSLYLKAVLLACLFSFSFLQLPAQVKKKKSFLLSWMALRRMYWKSSRSLI